jgi:hypothetical protein
VISSRLAHYSDRSFVGRPIGTERKLRKQHRRIFPLSIDVDCVQLTTCRCDLVRCCHSSIRYAFPRGLLADFRGSTPPSSRDSLGFNANYVLKKSKRTLDLVYRCRRLASLQIPFHHVVLVVQRRRCPLSGGKEDRGRLVWCYFRGHKPFEQPASRHQICMHLTVSSTSCCR